MITRHKVLVSYLVRLRVVFSAKAYHFHSLVHNLFPVVPHSHRVYVMQFRMPSAYRALLVKKALIHIIVDVVHVLVERTLDGYIVRKDELHKIALKRGYHAHRGV